MCPTWQGLLFCFHLFLLISFGYTLRENVLEFCFEISYRPPQWVLNSMFNYYDLDKDINLINLKWSTIYYPLHICILSDCALGTRLRNREVGQEVHRASTLWPCQIIRWFELLYACHLCPVSWFRSDCCFAEVRRRSSRSFLFLMKGYIIFIKPVTCLILSESYMVRITPFPWTLGKVLRC